LKAARFKNIKNLIVDLLLAGRIDVLPFYIDTNSFNQDFATLQCGNEILTYEACEKLTQHI
jgi:hypothetical protein